MYIQHKYRDIHMNVETFIEPLTYTLLTMSVRNCDIGSIYYVELSCLNVNRNKYFKKKYECENVYAWFCMMTYIQI